MADEEKILLTKEAVDLIKKELEDRKTILRAEYAEIIAEAKAQGDLSENSEYADACERRTANEERILEIENFLKQVEIKDDNN